MTSKPFQSTIKPIRLHVKYNPPLIAIQYKVKQTDTKKRIYTIVLNKLIMHPNPQEIARQLYEEHPQVLNEKVIPMEQIARLVQIIQNKLDEIGMEDEEEQYDPKDSRDFETANPTKKGPKRAQFDFDLDRQFEEDDNPKLNHSR